MKRRIIPVALFALLLLIAGAAAGQVSPPTAEAVGQANLRRAPSVDSELVGAIAAGTRYPVIGRSALYPWLLLGDPASGAPLGWVFRDLVSVQGDLAPVPLTESPLSAAPPPMPTATLPAAQVGALTSPTLPVPTATATPVGAVTGTTRGEINLRYGPGVDYQRVGVGAPGETFSIVAYHTQFPWVQVLYPTSPNGLAWINRDLLDISGSLFTLPPISQTTFNLPTLTPTPSPLEMFSPVPISPAFRALGDSIFARMLSLNFDPATTRLGSFYLKDLRTGETLSFGSNFAFSGTSVAKIAVLAAYYDLVNIPPDDATAVTIASSMICSENVNTNRILARIGDGDPWLGARRTTEFLDRIGLSHTFIFTPYAPDPFVTPQPAQTRRTDIDQSTARPDPFYQTTAADMGALLDAMYQCGYGDPAQSVLLTRAGEGRFTPDECRHMLNIMRHNRIGNFIESGTPAEVIVSHKHGWIDDTHGDAAVVFSPGGDYILVFMLHSPGWLAFPDSELVIEESSREVYNYFNPDAPLEAVRPPDVSAECNLLGSPAIIEMQRLSFP